MRTIAIISAVMTFGILHAQPGPDSVTHSNGTLSVSSTPPGAIVLIDGDSVGVTPTGPLPVAPGSHTVRIMTADVGNWLDEPVTDTVSIHPVGLHALHKILPRKYLLLTSPSGAEVVRNDTVIGRTPFVARKSLEGMMVRKDGYESAIPDPSTAQRNIVSITLKRIWSNTTEESIFKDAEDDRSPLKLYITGAATVISGAAAAYFKVKADNEYGRYLSTGNPSNLSETNRLDVAAGVALAATQISLGFFTYFILSEY